MAKRVWCYLGVHDWVQHVTEGEVYFKCRHCGKYSDKASAVVRYGGQR
jgi:hypothetical protein